LNDGPSTPQFVGACAATLLASRYLVTKDATIGDDASDFVAKLGDEFPAVDDVVAPVTALADVDDVKASATEWYEGVSDPVEEIAFPAAGVAAALLLGNVASWPVLGVFAPRVLELMGVAVAVAAVKRYGDDEGSVGADLTKYADDVTDAVKTLIGK
jgi:hypothetical protein